MNVKRIFVIGAVAAACAAVALGTAGAAYAHGAGHPAVTTVSIAGDPDDGGEIVALAGDPDDGGQIR